MTADQTLSAGVAALEQGRYADALAHFAPLAKQRPGDINVLLALASAQLGAGDAGAALITATDARAKAPNPIAALYVLAPAAALTDEEETFRACLTQLSNMAPKEALGLGAFWTARLIEHGHFVAAARVQRELVALAPENYDVRVGEADTLLRMGETDAAGAALGEALRLDAARGEAHALMAQQRLQAGDLDGAKQSALAAISRSPHAVPAYAALAELDPSALDDDMLSRLREVTREDRASPENRAAAGMALAAALDARGRRDDAFDAILEARHELARADVQRG
jgi:tetratricopeptide (TPR) repeat protein